MVPYKSKCFRCDADKMEGDWEGEVVHEGWLTKSPPLETKTRQIFSQTLIQPVSVVIK